MVVVVSVMRTDTGQLRRGLELGSWSVCSDRTIYEERYDRNHISSMRIDMVEYLLVPPPKTRRLARAPRPVSVTFAYHRRSLRSL